MTGAQHARLAEANPRAHAFTVEGVDMADGSRTELYSCDSSGEARQWLRGYTSSEDAGGWDLIEVYDVRGEDAERVAYWERESD